MGMISKKVSGWIELPCPFCRKDSKKVLQVTPDMSFAHCFRCQWRGTVREVCDAYGLSKEQLFGDTCAIAQLPQTSFSGEIPGVSFLKSKTAISYIRSRKAFSYATLNRWKYNKLDVTNSTVVIPLVQDYMLKGYLERSINSVAFMRYKFSSGFSSSSCFFNWDLTRWQQSVVLSEGVFDAISLHNALPFVGALGNFGKHLSEEKISMLYQRHFKEITICLDSEKKDKDIRKAINYIASKLMFIPCTLSIMRLQEGDPNESEYSVLQQTFFSREVIH